MWFWTHLFHLRQKFRDADKVVADQIEQNVGGDSDETPVFRFAHDAVLLPPSKQTLDHFAFTLRDVVALVPGGSSVDGRLTRPSSLRHIIVDGDVRRDILCPQAFNVFCNIIGLVRTNRDACVRRAWASLSAASPHWCRTGQKISRSWNCGPCGPPI